MLSKVNDFVSMARRMGVAGRLRGRETTGKQRSSKLSQERLNQAGGTGRRQIRTWAAVDRDGIRTSEVSGSHGRTRPTV